MKKRFHTIILYATLVLAVLFIVGMPLLAGAQDDPGGYKIITSIPGTEIRQDDPTSKFTLQTYVQQIYLFALGIVGLVAVFAIVFWAFMYIIAAGNPSKMSDAMGGIKDAILGLVLLLLAALILNLINPSLTTLRSFDDYIKPIPGPEKRSGINIGSTAGKLGSLPRPDGQCDPGLKPGTISIGTDTARVCIPESEGGLDDACQNNNDCYADYQCSGGKCTQALLPPGSFCLVDSQCQSGQCTTKLTQSQRQCE